MSGGYYIIDPPNPLPGTLAVLLPADQEDRYKAIVTERRFSRYTIRAILADTIPLAADLVELVDRPSRSLLYVNEEPLTLHLQYAGYLPYMFNLHRSNDTSLSHIDFLVDSNHPVATLATARTAINQLLDVMMRSIWLPLSIIRLDVFEDGATQPLLHQITFPFSDKLAIGPLGGFGSFAPLTPYEALLREAIASASPYYRFVCSFKLLEGIGTLRKHIKELVDKYGVEEQIPKQPDVDPNVVKGLGFEDSFAKRLKKASDLVKEFKTARNALSHFLLDMPDAEPLNVADGANFRIFSGGGALLLLYAHRSVADLMIYFNANLHGHLARGSRVVFPEDWQLYVIKVDGYTGRIGQFDEDEEEEMNRPMFVKVVDGSKVEFINVTHIVRVEVIHPTEGKPGSASLYLHDGTTRTLGEGEVNWIMRMMSGLLGQPEPGTQNFPPGYWSGSQEQG